MGVVRMALLLKTGTINNNQKILKIKEILYVKIMRQVLTKYNSVVIMFPTV